MTSLSGPPKLNRQPGAGHLFFGVVGPKPLYPFSKRKSTGHFAFSCQNAGYSAFAALSELPFTGHFRLTRSFSGKRGRGIGTIGVNGTAGVATGSAPDRHVFRLWSASIRGKPAQRQGDEPTYGDAARHLPIRAVA
jgi:hypothetical protein